MKRIAKLILSLSLATLLSVGLPVNEGSSDQPIKYETNAIKSDPGGGPGV
ncbi:hypothetical protein [Rossellomorea marisflavi]